MRAVLSQLLAFVLLAAFAAGAAAAQQDSTASDSAHTDSLRADSAGPDGGRADSARPDSVATDTVQFAPPHPPHPPPPPTPEQERYLQGLQRVGRGVAQLRVAVDQVARTQSAGDSVSRRRAAYRLGGYCVSARSFMTGGRARMQHTAYEDTTRTVARQLARTVDELIKYAPTCEADAGGAAQRISAELAKRLAAYDSALVAFRGALGLPGGPGTGGR